MVIKESIIDLAAKDVFVLAGNNQQARDYFRWKKFPYDPRKVINRVDDLRGRSDGTVVCVGAHFGRKDRQKMCFILRCNNMKVMFDDF